MVSSAVDASVVIACADRWNMLRRQLDALALQRWDGSWEVVVADGGSPDDLGAAVSELAPERNVRVVDATDRRGAAHARNAGAAAAGGRLLLFVDADDEVAPGYLRAMASALESQPLVAARLDVETLNEAWQVQMREPAQVRGLGTGFLPFAYGCSLGVRREVFESLGGFDPGIAGTADDIDLCWRAGLAGVPLTFVPDAVVRYRLRGTLRSVLRQARAYGFSGAVLYRRYRLAGFRRPPAGAALRGWLGTLHAISTARDRAGLARGLFLLGRRVGAIEGAVRNRIVWW